MEIQAFDDDKLLKACSDGKTEAFEIIVRKYKSFICALTYSAVGDLEKSEELTQEIFIIAWNNLSQLRDLSKFRNWLYSIAKNHIRYFFRIRKKDILSSVVPITKSNPVATSQDDPVKRLISKETQQQLWNALSHIPLHYREPLVSYYWEGKSVRQVARLFDLTEVTAKQRLSRARTMVRGNIETYMKNTVAASSPAGKFSAGVIALITAGAVIKTGTASAAAATAITGTKASGWLSAWLGTMSAKIILTVSSVAIILTTGTFIIQSRSNPDTLIPIYTLPPELDNGMVMYLSFDHIEDGSKPVKIIDESYTGNDGILLGGEFVKGKIGDALKCNANNKSDGVRIKSHFTLDLNVVTIAVWIKTGQIDGYWNRILDKGWRTAYNLCIGGDFKGQKWRQNRTTLECTNNSITSKKTVVDDKWHFVVGTYDGRTLKLYIDGQPDAERKLKKYTPMKHNDVDIMVGSLAVPEPWPQNYAFFDGLIDEVRLYNRVLTEQEIRTLYRYQPD